MYKSRLVELAAQDQADRRNLSPADFANPKKMQALASRDIERQEYVDDLYEAGKIKKPIDLASAAIILQHSVLPEDYQLAHELAGKALKLKPSKEELETFATNNGQNFDQEKTLQQWYSHLNWLYTITIDRFLMATGKQQKYGTQILMVPGGKKALYPVDPTVTDEERAKYGVPTLAELEKQVDTVLAWEDVKALSKAPKG
jgi:hypothetical protein